MDIRNWLAETESPARAEQLDFEHFLLPKNPVTVLRPKGRRKRSSSDSSLLKTPSPIPHPKQTATGSRRADHATQRCIAISHSNTPRYAQSESMGSTAGQRYLRKSRHKTHPDKYAVKSEGPKQQAERHSRDRGKGSKKRNRKSKQPKDEKTHRGVGQNYHARNVAKDRVTVSTLHKIRF